ncbi:hypothetical protein HY008_00580, partial [Candidatus Woesebacteria bacterium]|nr:hypothetical protein [Candidatus Woesebacteria bacterium]
LVQPISNYCKASYSIVDFATLAFGFSMQGVTISGVSRSSDLTVSNINLTRVLPVNVLSGGSGIFNPSPSPVQLIDQNGVPIPVTSAGVAYDIFEKAPGYLRKKLGNLTLFPGVNTAPTSWNTIRLLAGDFSTPTLAFDNVLNIFDLGAILSVYTQLSVPITSVDMKQYDIDGNNVLNIIDIAYVLSNYTQLQVPGD